MTIMPAGVTPASEGFDNVVCSILGQTYTLKQQSADSLAWHAGFPTAPSCRRTSTRPRTNSSMC
jgi:hypothetical protein